MHRFSLLLLLFAASFSQAQAPKSDPSRLSIDRIFDSGDFRTEGTPPVKWLDAGGYTTLLPSKDHKGARDLVQVDALGKETVLVAAASLMAPGASEPLSINDYEISRDLDRVLIFTRSVKVWRQNTRGDYWTYQRSTGKLAKLGGDARPSTLMFAKLSPDGSRVAYVRENNLHVSSADGGPPTQLTTDGSHEVINGTFDWVYEEEFGCRDGWRWSPDGKQIAYWQLNTRGVPNFTLMDNTSGKYPTLQTFAYPKTGEQNSTCRVGVIASTGGGATRWLEVPGDTRTDFYIPRMEWLNNSRELALQRINRLQNALDVMIADANTGKVHAVHTELDSAWVDVEDDHLEWLDHENSFSWISEGDGWRHLYVISRDGNSVRRVTSGDYDVVRVVKIDEKVGEVYFISSPDNPTRRDLYRIALKGAARPVRVSPADQPGWHDYNISPDGKHAIHTHSAFGVPPRIEIVSLPDHKVVRTLATNDRLREALSQLSETPVEFFRTDIGDGVKLDGWMIKPKDFDPAKKYPLFFHVYGEPAGQTVVDRWGGNNYLWHRMLTEQGYIVACFDNRGTPCPRGRDWRKSVYRKIGTLASHDQTAAARVLLSTRPYLDPKRVGVWGWSGGGSMTLNLLFRAPDMYRMGMSVAPVPDMRLYDTIYQERYMGLPQDNGEDYRQGSPITHAEGLKGNLLIVHGTGDDNCHYQGVELLMNRLIELNKPFSMMAYPNRSHSINEGKNTSRHLYSLLTRYLHENLPANAGAATGK